MPTDAPLAGECLVKERFDEGAIGVMNASLRR